jgi:hypothetical protein
LPPLPFSVVKSTVSGMRPYLLATAVQDEKYAVASFRSPALPSRPAQKAASSDCWVPSVRPVRKSTCLYQSRPYDCR